VENLKTTCPLCLKNQGFEEIVEVKNTFASSDIFTFKPEKELKDKNYGRGDCFIQMLQCKHCGFIFNQQFNMKKMLQAYTSKEYYQQKNFNARLNKNLEQIKQSFLEFVNKDSVCLEIAPGHGDLLISLSNEVKFVYSIDPSPTSSMVKLKNGKHIVGFFEKNLLEKELHHKLDFVYFRHLLEHIETPRKFLEEIAEFLDDEAVIYIEVPNVEEIMENEKFYEFFYDHIGYYQTNILINILSELGFEFIKAHYPYEAQWQGLFFKKNKKAQKQNLAFKLFSCKEIKALKNAQNEFNEWLLEHKNIALCGAGIQANAILPFLSEENVRKIRICLDKNEEKIGRFLQDSSIVVIQEASKENLKNITCIVMTMSLHEKFVVENEIMKLAQNNIWGGGCLSLPPRSLRKSS